MADVARLAGVSAMTVSRALRREASVSALTRARILEVVDEVGYVPDQAAGALSSGHSGLIAAIMPTLTVPLFAHVSKGLSETLFHAGLELYLGASDYSAEREQDLLQSMLRRRPEAVVLAGVGRTGKATRMLAGAGIPVVEFMDGVEPPIGHLIGLDFAEIGRATVNFLAGRGRRRIAILAARGDVDRCGEARVESLVAAARDVGLPEPVVLRHGSPSSPVDQGARSARAAIERRTGADVFVFMNDYAAIGGLSALRAAGVKTPDEVAVFGFGDCDVASVVSPALTTISFNPAAAGVEIGKVVMSALEAVRHGRRREPYRITLDFQVIVRDSA